MKKKTLLSSILTIALCLSLIAGSTFALFTSESKVNVAVTAGNVEVVATVEDLNLSSTLAAGNLNETSATEQDNTITLSKIVPGDVVTFNLRIKNNSDVSIKYRTIITKVADDGLWNGLEVTIDGTIYDGTSKVSTWETAAPGSADIIVPVKVTLPESAGNEYKLKTCTFAYTVEAVQGNADVTDAPADDSTTTAYYTVATAEELKALAGTTLPNGAVIDIVSDIDLAGTEIPAIAAAYGGTLTVNGNSNVISNASVKTPGKQNGMDNYGLFYVHTDGTLTINNLTIDGAIVEATSTNYGTAVLVGYADGGSTVNLNNVDVKNSSVTNTYDEAAIYVSYCTGNINMTDCDVINCTVAGENTTNKTSVGIGHLDGGTAVLKNCTEDNATYDWCHRNDGTLVVDGVYYVTNEAGVVSALTANAADIKVVLQKDVSVAITKLGSQTSGSGEYKLGGEETENITIDLNGKKLTLTTSYMTAIGAKNADATITIKNGSMNGTGNSATTWNINDLIFANCNYVFENVVFDKEVALENAGKTATMKNVTINGTGDYYALWISARGQNVEIDGLTVNTTGRAIKIDEQYVATPAEVTLNISNAKFSTTNKAAIMVKSSAGADITVSNVDISDVTADTTNVVWVDADASAHANLVKVTGATSIVEP